MEKEIEISLIEIMHILWNKCWVIILSMILGGGIGFAVTNYMIEPTYSSRISMYVNNTENTITQLSINDIDASRKLVSTYIEILKSDMVLNQVNSKIKVPYSNNKLSKMISAKALNDTQILEIKVISTDPNEAAEIANILSEVVPGEINRVLQVGGVKLIDNALINTSPIGPDVERITLIWGILGALLACIIILVIARLDNRIKSEEDLVDKYDIPVLGVIPDILEGVKK